MNNLFKKLKLKRRVITALYALHIYGDPSKKLKIVGVTGTNGKTTITTLLYKVMTELGYKAGLIGTIENRIGNQVVPATHTTPDPVSLNKLLNKMVDSGCEYVFMEVSSHALDQGRVAGVSYVGGIFTNLTHDHLDYHPNFESYFLAKKKFFKMLPPSAFALSNADDEYGAKMLEDIKAQKYTYGFKNPSSASGQASDFNEKLETKLIGDFNVYNALAVYATLVLLGIDKEKVKETMKNIEPPRGRFEYFNSPNGVLVIVDYAHTPDALKNVLQTIHEIKRKNPSTSSGQVITVFGCGGDRDPLKRPIMGRIGAEMSDIAIFTSDNPRSEDPEKIIAEMQTGLSRDIINKIKTIPNRREAIAEAVSLASPGDIILTAGKGHEDYQEINGVKYHFDDMEEFKKAYGKI